MKKKVAVFLLAALIIIMSVSPAAADSTGVCFTAVDDSLLDSSYMATWYGGQVCVPCSTFSYLGIYYSYFAESSVLQMYSGANQLFFDLANGGCSSGNDSTFTASAVSRGGVIYVPASFVAGFFGSYASFISGNGFGDIIRIKSGGAMLTDAQFLNAAESLMRARLGLNETSPGGSSTPTPTPTPTPSPSDELKSGNISLCYVGMPDSSVLDALDSGGYYLPVCFLVTAQEAEDSPETVRRISGSGHILGVYCSSETGKNATDALAAIFNAAFVRLSFIVSDSSMEEYAKNFAADNDMVYITTKHVFSSDVSPETVTTSLNAGGQTVVLITEGSGHTASDYASRLRVSGFRLTALRETFFK